VRALRGQCHCGDLGYRLDWPAAAAPLAVQRCGCGFCARHGARWLARPDAPLMLELAPREGVLEYRFASQTVTFLVCARCGILTAARARADDRDYGAVNANTLDGFESLVLVEAAADPVDETLAARRARIARTWSPLARAGAAP
jgi:hypothetical protein